MPEAELPRPTDAELEILKVLWRRGPSTVREVFETLGESKTTGYTTVLKFMQIMAAKGSLVRDESVRPQRYRAARPKQQTQRGILRDLVGRAFGGSSASLVMQALSDQPASEEERRQIRELLDTLDKKVAR